MNKKKLFRWLVRLLVALVFVLAFRLLYGIIKEYSLAEVLASVKQIPTALIVIAVALTVVNYAILVGYDYLAVRYVKEPLALWKIALASFVSYACSYNIGSTVAGTTVRYRLYSAWGVPPWKILHLLVILGLTFWFGVFALAGTIFVVDPPRVPKCNDATVAADLAHHIQHRAKDKEKQDELLRKVTHTLRWLGQYMRPLGIVLLLIALAYVAMAAFHNGSVNIRFHLRRLNVDWTLPVPPLKLTAYQIVVASADLLVAAWVLYLLMPSMGIDYLKFVGIYMVAYVLVVISHVPGGFGVLEPGILLMLPEQHRLAGFAALVVFRIIYYWAPLVIALTLLSVYEIAIHRRSPASLNAPAPSEVSALQPSQKS